MNPVSFEIEAAISRAEDIAIISHDRPDGDALGSSIGLGLLLEKQGKRIEILNADPVPESLCFLPHQERIRNRPENRKPDLIIVVDSAGRDRVRKELWESLDDGIPLINIDHHISNPGYGDINLVDCKSPATGQIICELAIELGWEIDLAVADNLYAAISTDTGSFRYPNTTSKTYRIAAELIDAGAAVGRMNQLLYEQYPVRRVEVLRDLLNDMELCFDGRCVSVSLPLSLSQRLALKPGDTEGVVDVIRAIDTVIVAVLFEELPDGKIRVSSRSKMKEVSVGQICETFGGGGHTLAAGTRMKGPIEEARERFLKRVKDELDRFDSGKVS